MTAERPRLVVTPDMRIITLAGTPEPSGVTSNIGHPREPVVVGLCLGEAEPFVTLSEGSGHLGSGGAFRLDEILTGSGALQQRWEEVFARASAHWVLPILNRLAAGESLTEDEVLEARRTQQLATAPTGELFFATPRLVVRRFTPADLDVFVGYRQDPEVARYQGWSSFGSEQGAEFIAEMAQAEPGVPGVWFQFAVAETRSGELVGDLALHVDADEPRIAEVGFTFARASQGQGYATEALRGYLDHLFSTFALHRVVAITDARNALSAALLERVGFRREAHLRENTFFKGEWSSELVYAVLAPEWPGAG